MTPMKRIASTFATFALLLTPTVVLTAAPAVADTETCVTHAEFDNTFYGESPTHVAIRFDVYGVLMDDTQTYYRRHYRTCWAPGERWAIVEYSYDTGDSIDWYVRDVS